MLRRWMERTRPGLLDSWPVMMAEKVHLSSLSSGHTLPAPPYSLADLKSYVTNFCRLLDSLRYINFVNLIFKIVKDLPNLGDVACLRLDLDLFFFTENAEDGSESGQNGQHSLKF
jgi:hypothetical protein